MIQKNINSHNSEDTIINISKFKYAMILYELHQIIRQLCVSHKDQITTNEEFPLTSGAFCTKTHNINTYKRGERGK